ncbi:SDR family NAD(P)-dependent oxidoreductase [Cytobacillus sp. FJAT-54145]|uniref:SDR family NAD(P)-dependent oxidoreductase n=1 Tax=Cytobacillus spartinae TaxID=3299023 RepID=A0ABW6KI91_9BACI
MARHSLIGKTIFITGASGGIGAEMARLCAGRGANLALFARSLQKLEDLKKELESCYQVRVNVYQLDVSDTDSVKETFPKAISELGGVDILVNNAGFGVFREAHEASVDEVTGMFNVNVVGLIACSSVVLPYMRDQRSGHIINIASQAGKIATPKSSVYSATKHAVLGYTNSLRMELSNLNVFVTAVNPGPIATNFFAIADEKGTYVKNVQKFMLQPEFVAKKVVDAMFTRTREINLPRWMNFGSAIYVLFPGLFEKIAGRMLKQK